MAFRNVFFLLIPILLNGVSLHAGRLPADVEISAGFEDTLPLCESLLPVTVSIRNTIASTSGHIVLSYVNLKGDHEVETALPFTSPVNSQKQFLLFTRPNAQSRRQLKVVVRFAEAISTETRQFQIAQKVYRHVLCVDIPATDGLRSQLSKPYRLIHLPDANALFEDPRAYDALSAVILSGQTLLEMSNSRLEALMQWLATGGRVIITRAGDDRQMLKQLSVLAGPTVTPEAFDKIRLSGSGLLFFTDDSTSVSTNKVLLHELFPLTAMSEDDWPQEAYNSWPGILKNLWATNSASGIASLGWILLIVGAYVVVIGPLDHYLTKRFQRPALTWVIFSAAVIGFSIISFAYTSLVNVGNMRIVTAEILDIDLSKRIMRGNSMLWVYSARNASYDMTVKPGKLTFTGHEPNEGIGRQLAPVDINATSTPNVRARIPIFSSKSFDATWYDDAPEGLKVEDVDGQIILTVPEDLPVSNAYVATYTTLLKMENEGTQWHTQKSQVQSISWDSEMNQFQEDHQPQYDLYFGERTELPEQASLRRLLRLLTASPGSQIDTANATAASGEDHLDLRNPRERYFDMGSHLRHDRRIVFLELSPDYIASGFSVDNRKSKSSHACLMRIVLPENTP